MSTRFDTLEGWLGWQETLHPSAIDLGLARVRAVAEHLGLTRPAPVVFTVGGTNGKGSTVAFLEAMLRAGGYRVGAYTSPHLVRYNERVRIDGSEAGDTALCEAFERIDRARGDISITYFEFGTLAALDLFQRAGLDAAILEVGMGGRLDAVNIVDADVALVTTVDLDHMQWLGPDRESIGREKAGIFRAGRPAICVEPDPPQSLIGQAEAIGARLLRLGRDFDFRREAEGWRWEGLGRTRAGLPLPALRGAIQLRNASGALAALAAAEGRLPLDQAAIRSGLLTARVAGRFQVLPGDPATILDVGHNPQATAQLAAHLREFGGEGRLHAVVGMLSDKEIGPSLAPLLALVGDWFPATLSVPRGAPAERLAAALEGLGAGGRIAGRFDDVESAYAAARAAAGPRDRVLVFGSFHTVGAVLGPAGAARV